MGTLFLSLPSDLKFSRLFLGSLQIWEIFFFYFSNLVCLSVCSVFFFRNVIDFLDWSSISFISSLFPFIWFFWSSFWKSFLKFIFQQNFKILQMSNFNLLCFSVLWLLWFNVMLIFHSRLFLFYGCSVVTNSKDTN